MLASKFVAHKPVNICFSVITKAGVVYTMLPLKDTHKLWIYCSLQIPSYWIKPMRMGYKL